MPTGQLPVTAHLNLGHEVKQISYQVGLCRAVQPGWQEWHDAWQPGMPRDVVFTIPEGAIEGAPLIVEAGFGIMARRLLGGSRTGGTHHSAPRSGLAWQDDQLVDGLRRCLSGRFGMPPTLEALCSVTPMKPLDWLAHPRSPKRVRGNGPPEMGHLNGRLEVRAVSLDFWGYHLKLMCNSGRLQWH